MLQNQGDAPGPHAQEAFARLLNVTAVTIRARALGGKSVALPADRRAPSSFPSVRLSVPGRAHRTLVNESRKSRVHAQAARAGVCLSAASFGGRCCAGRRTSLVAARSVGREIRPLTQGRASLVLVSLRIPIQGVFFSLFSS